LTLLFYPVSAQSTGGMPFSSKVPDISERTGGLAFAKEMPGGVSGKEICRKCFCGVPRPGIDEPLYEGEERVNWVSGWRRDKTAVSMRQE